MNYQTLPPSASADNTDLGFDNSIMISCSSNNCLLIELVNEFRLYATDRGEGDYCELNLFKFSISSVIFLLDPVLILPAMTHTAQTFQLTFNISRESNK